MVSTGVVSELGVFTFVERVRSDWSSWWAFSNSFLCPSERYRSGRFVLLDALVGFVNLCFPAVACALVVVGGLCSLSPPKSYSFQCGA